MASLTLIRLIGGFVNLLINVPIIFLEIFLSKEERIKRKVKKTPAKSLSEIKVGEYVKIEGTAMAHERLMTSPLSKKRCIGYQLKVGRDRSDFHEDDYIKEEIIQQFFVRQGNKRIRIIPNKGRIDLKMKTFGTSGLFKDADARMQALLKRHATKSTFLGFNKSLTFREGILEEGDEITVIGKVSVLRSRNKEPSIVIRDLEKHPLYLKKR